MPTLAPRLSALAPRIPVRIDLTWLKGRAAAPEADAAPPVPTRAQLHESAERARLMNQILEFNPTASPDFLAQFAPGELAEYLDHLTAAAMPRGRDARRIRPEGTPCVCVQTAAV
jgi:hypothetical protein